MSTIKSILVANNHLETFGGSETFTYSLIKKLIKKKYEVEYFTFKKGFFSEKIENELQVNFMSKKSYDLILANHNTCVYHLKNKGFIIQTCHGIYPELEQPSFYADFHVSISQEVSNHLALKGFSNVVIMNGIDVNRFKNRTEVNEKLTNVLSLCQSEEANVFLKKVCDKLNLNFTYLNKFENAVWNVEELINKNDLVIGLGRSAYEAMACGRPVVVFDKRPYSESYADGYVVNVLANSLVNNCSGRFYKRNMDLAQMIEEFSKYKKADGEILRKFIVDNLNIELVVDRYVKIYEEIKRNRKEIYRLNFFQFFKNKYGIKKAIFITKKINKSLYKRISKI